MGVDAAEEAAARAGARRRRAAATLPTDDDDGESDDDVPAPAPAPALIGEGAGHSGWKMAREGAARMAQSRPTPVLRAMSVDAWVEEEGLEAQVPGLLAKLQEVAGNTDDLGALRGEKLAQIFKSLGLKALATQSVQRAFDYLRAGIAYERAEAEGAAPSQLRDCSKAMLKATMGRPDLSHVNLDQLAAAIDAGRRAGLEKRILQPAVAKFKQACVVQGRSQYRSDLWQGK
jgi:hypothetical protein